MINKVKNYIEENELLSFGDRVVVGLSGGADSVCLLKILIDLQSEYGLKIYGVHVNHNIRGDEALRDEEFAAFLCKKLKVEFIRFSYDIPRLAKEEGLTEEECGRVYRYKAFEETAEKTGAERIALAHNKNDNAETMLQRLLRGTGLKGLGGILPKRDKIIRPLLCLTRAEIEDYLGDFEHITDSTNSNTEYTRNRIRLRLLPEIERDFNPNIIETLYRSSVIFRKENEFLEEESRKGCERAVISRSNRRIVLDCDILNKENDVLVGRILRLACLPLTKKGQDIEYKHIEDLKKLCKGKNGRKIALIEGLEGRKEFNRLIIGSFENIDCEYDYEIQLEKEVVIAEAGLKILLSRHKRDEKEYGILREEKLVFPLRVRTKRSGDRLPIKGGRQEIKKIFSEKKINTEDRHKYPLLVSGENVIAVINLKKGFGYFTENNGIYIYISLVF
ncbi:MAG: tRNA lysidine(34) synthetase TilS [Clostridiales bacterium]|nr:tRNA lysidine(34) synthetase TilS [Clostridiales bacterium]